MRRGMAIAVLLLEFSPAARSSQQILTTGNIEGTVVRADTGAPITGAQVTLMAVRGPQRLATQPIATNKEGEFVFQDISAGGYRVAASADGFVRQEYGQKAVNGPGRTVFVSDGQTTKGTAIRLLPAGTVSGRVFDENGQSATGAPVQIFRPLYGARGRTLEQVAIATANDRGEYRAYGVPPGHYFLLAGTPAKDPRIVQRGPAGNARFSLVYYPNVTEVDQATAVEVSSGAETAIDFNVRRLSRTFRVRGRVIGVENTLPQKNLNVNLVVRLQNGTGVIENLVAYKAETGTFEFLNVVPGEYFVEVSTANNGGAFGGGIEQAKEASRAWGQAAVRIVDTDVEGVLVNLSTGETVSGRVIIEGQAIGKVPNVDQLGFRLDFPVPLLSLTAPAALPVADDGTFKVVGLREGDYRSDLYAPTGFYVKNLRFGGEDIQGKIFHYSGSGSGEFEVVLRPGGVQVSGTLTDVHSELVAGMPVFLVPADRGRMDLYRQTTTDQAGRFTMPAIPPGDYKLFSWEVADNGEQYDSAFMQQYEQAGKTIHVAETAPMTADIRTIPPR